MTKQITHYLSIEIEVKKSDSLPSMNEGYAMLYDHNTGRVIRTIRGQYILAEDTEEDFYKIAMEELKTVITRYNLLATLYKDGDSFEKSEIEEWLVTDPQFNDAKWHGDDRK